MTHLDQLLTRQVIEEMEAEGDDLSISRPVNFQFVFASEASATDFARAAAERGSTTDVEELRDASSANMPWDVNVAIRMKPELATVSAWEIELARLAETHGGRADGWFWERVPVSN